MNVVKATRRFEDWLGRHTEIIKPDLRLKHSSMKAAIFPFLRATYYRWVQIWPKICPDLAQAPRVLSVGDLHVENFGTWRDREGRLIWGVNDFDEASPLSYANDLVRLAVGAHLAAEAGQLGLKTKGICDSILEGYIESLRSNGRPFVLGEHNTWLRQIAQSKLRDPIRFWKKMDTLPAARAGIPVSAIDALEHLMPAPNLTYRVVRRTAGLGSLGHARFVAIAEWCGGRIAREAKALVYSASHWAGDQNCPAEILYQALISQAVRCPDPFVQLRGRWIVRRLAPDCSRIELAALSAPGAELRLLHAMGWETANIHLGTKSAPRLILRDLGKRKQRWLHAATDDMLRAVRSDWETWKEDGYA